MRKIYPKLLVIVSLVFLTMALIYSGIRIYQSYNDPIKDLPKANLTIKAIACEGEQHSIRMDIGRHKADLEINRKGKIYEYEPERDFLFYGIDTIRNLPVGTYTITYTNIYNQKIETPIIIGNSYNEFEFCPDKLYDTPISTSFSEFLRTKNDKWEINIESKGCFHHSTQTLSVYQTYDNDLFAVTFIEDEEPKWVTTKKLDDLMIINDFEKKIRLLTESEGDCTTRNTYQIKFGKSFTELKDYSCLSDKLLYELIEELKKNQLEKAPK